MLGTIAFHYRTHDDVVVATPRWHVETPGDIVRWFGQYEAYLEPFGRPMDMVLLLDDFRVDAAVGVRWGATRARMQRLYTRLTCRVGVRSQARLYVNTSGVLHDASTQVAPSLEAAVAWIKETRRNLGPTSSHGSRSV